MFQVRTSSPFDDDWYQRDERLFEVAGCPSSFSGTDFAGRDHGWLVPTFADAVKLKDRLETVPFVTVTIREE